jgi:hypothetical protein
MSAKNDKDDQHKPEETTNTKMAATQLFVAKRYRANGQEVPDAGSEENELIEVRKFQTEPAIVGITYGLTVNMGNYESCRVEVSLRLPCYAEEKDAACEHAKKWVEGRVMAEVDSVRKKTGARVDF